MQIIFKKRFLKQYRDLRKSDQSKVDHMLEIFEKNPEDSRLRNHALQGKLAGKRSLAAGFDLRIVFSVEGDYVIVTMIAVGTHEQVY